MKSSELKVGTWYNIKYRMSTERRNPGLYTWNNPYKESLVAGVGKLTAINAKDWHHAFEVPGIGTVYATSNSVFSESMFAPTQSIVDTDDPEVEKLRQLGFDDDKRAAEIEKIQQFLLGLDIEAEPNEGFTGLTIPYAGLARLKTLVAQIYSRHLLDEDDE